MTPQDFMSKYKDKIDDETFVEMSSDVESISAPADTTELDAAKAEAAEYKAKYEDILAKYKERFLSSETVEPEEVDEPKVEEEIDIKEI